MKDILVIDGSHGEGGGQILRSSLALSLVTGTPFRLVNIRAGRAKPGLMRQHLTAVQAASAIGGAQVEGVAVGAREITFHPGAVQGGTYNFAIGTAGSATLVLQAVLPALLTAKNRTTLVLEGGTHNPFAPPFDYIQRVFIPVLGKMGARITISLERYGFYPAGGGKFTVEIEPVERLQPLHIPERGKALRRTVRSIVANLSPAIARRELSIVKAKFPWPEESFVAEEVSNSRGPGNILFIELEHEHITEVVTAFGEQGVPAETVAAEAAKLARQYLASTAPVGICLADQILLPFAMAGEGSFRSLPLSRHALTNIDIIRRFLPVQIDVSQQKVESSVVVRT